MHNSRLVNTALGALMSLSLLVPATGCANRWPSASPIVRVAD